MAARAAEEIDLIREFLAESQDNLSRLNREILELEKSPGNRDLLDSVFRTIHTIKGTSGFFHFPAIGRITHEAEAILCRVRDGGALTPRAVSLILEVADALDFELAAIGAANVESGRDWSGLLARLENARFESVRMEMAAACAFRPMPEPESAESKIPKPARNGGPADSSVRVETTLLNRLAALVDELAGIRNQLLRSDPHAADPGLNTARRRLDIVTAELQDLAIDARMQPLAVIWNKFPRIVRDMAAASGKRMELSMDGGSLRLDRTLIDAIRDPLTHLLRNACDHGIEAPDVRLRHGKPAQGTIAVRAFHDRGNIHIEVTDDGRGIETEQIRAAALRSGFRAGYIASLTPRELMNLVFTPGLSTATIATGISGRGVGMDVVKTNVERIGGAVDLVSVPGKGSTVHIRIPLT